MHCCDCDHCGGSVGCPVPSAGFVPHEIWNGVEVIQANLNEGDLEASTSQIIASHNGINMVAIGDDGLGRVAWDATVYRFSDSSAHPNVAVTYYDNPRYVRNLACWLAGDCNPAIEVEIDVKPGGCPNPLNIGSRGMAVVDDALAQVNPRGETSVLPVAILGTSDLDVDLIDPASVRLIGVPPLRWGYEDVATPYVGDDDGDCGCSAAGPDRIMDLTLKFNRSAIIAAIGPVVNGQEVLLQLTGNLFDGTQIQGADCVLIRAEKSGSAASVEPQGDVPFASSNFPNPFNAATLIRYNLTDVGHVNLAIYNVLGERVATLVDELQPAGPHEVVWNGTDAHDRTAASGMYFYRLTTGGFSQSRKMVLLK